MEKNGIIIIGMGGHAKSVIDSIEKMGCYEIAGFVDRDGSAHDYKGYRCLGDDTVLERIYASGVHNAAIGIGYIDEGSCRTRRRIYETLKRIGYELPVIADPSAVIAGNACIGEGSWIGKLAVVNADTNLGACCIVNTAAVVEHDVVIGDHSHISVRAALCGAVTVGENSFIGAGATVIQGTAIHSGAFVGAGSVVIKDVDEKKRVAGVPARIMTNDR